MLDFDYDVLIVGGGLNGASLAYALALLGSGLRIGLIEPRALSPSFCVETDYDARSIALAHGSQLIYEHLGLWECLAPHVTPLHEVHVSEKGCFGSLCFRAIDLDVRALGYVLPAVTLQKVLNNALHLLSKKGLLDLIYPAKVTAVYRDTEAITVEYAHPLTFESTSDGRKLTTVAEIKRVKAKLVVGADGADSSVRNFLHVPTVTHHYKQTALVATVHLARHHYGVAYERFTQQGVLAMLPLLASSESLHRCTLVWTVEEKQAVNLLRLKDTDFLHQVQTLFGYRLGRLQALGKRSAVSLRKVSALETVQARWVLIGNAAHALHPLAAQGLNLGLRDMAVLLEVILEANAAQQDVGRLDVLTSYQVRRRTDQAQMTAFVEGLIKLFSKQNRVCRVLRSLGGQLLDSSPMGQYCLARLLLGTAGRVSKLASGMPL